MKIRRMRNNVKLTDIVQPPPQPGRTMHPYGFGVIMDGAEQPNFVFFPPKLIARYEIKDTDIGEILDCVFRDDPRRKDHDGHKQDPVVMAIFYEDDPVQETVVLDSVEVDASEDPDTEPPCRDTLSLPIFVTR